MKRQRIYVAAEIGTSKTCIAAAEVTEDNTLNLLGITKKKSEGVTKGIISCPRKAYAVFKDVLLETENRYDLDIANVCLSVSGGHIQGVNYRGTYSLPENEQQVTAAHLDLVEKSALDTADTESRINLLHMVRHYELDSKRYEQPPLNLSGKKLSVEYHCIHGNTKQIETNIQCIRSIVPEIAGIVFSPMAASLATLDQQLMKAGALVIDMGAGTTDYVLYSNNSIVTSGCVPLGGNDVTHEIHRATGIPIALAEQLKIKAGNASGIPDLDIDSAHVINSVTLSSIKVRRKLINRIIRFTLQNILSSIRQNIPSDILDRLECKLYLTGGGCQQKGLTKLAGDTFGIPVNYLGLENCPRCDGKFWKPQYSVVIGLLHYESLMEV